MVKRMKEAGVGTKQQFLIGEINRLIEQVDPKKQKGQPNTSPTPNNINKQEDTANDVNNLPDPSKENPGTSEENQEMGGGSDGAENEAGMGSPEEMGGDPSGGGDTGETSLNDVGKMYELQQIHNRLIAIRNHLSIFVEKEFDEVKKSLSKAISLFDLIVENYAKYSDKVDDIIVMYYQFIQNIYEVTKKKYKKYSKKNAKKKSGTTRYDQKYFN